MTQRQPSADRLRGIFRVAGFSPLGRSLVALIARKFWYCFFFTLCLDDTMLASSQTQFSVYSSVRSIFRLYSNPRSE